MVVPVLPSHTGPWRFRAATDDEGQDPTMDDSARDRAAQRGGRRPGTGSSVLTPPVGIPAVPDGIVPAQRAAPVSPNTPPKRPAVVNPCTCGHPKAAHEHYRAGTDCGVCGATACAGFRPAERTGMVRRLLRRS